jgi:hypothetical protein
MSIRNIINNEDALNDKSINIYANTINSDKIQAEQELIIKTGDDNEINYSTPDLGQPNYVLKTDGAGSTFWANDNGGGAGTLQDSYDLSTAPQIITDTKQFVIKSSTSDTIPLFKILNGSDLDRITMNGKGTLTCSTASADILKASSRIDLESNTPEVIFKDTDTPAGCNIDIEFQDSTGFARGGIDGSGATSADFRFYANGGGTVGLYTGAFKSVVLDDADNSFTTRGVTTVDLGSQTYKWGEIWATGDINTDGIIFGNKYIASMNINNNLSQTVISAVGVPVRGGSGWVNSSLTSPIFAFGVTGTYQYNGTKTIKVKVDFTMSWQHVGGADILASHYVGLNGTALTNTQIQVRVDDTSLYPRETSGTAIIEISNGDDIDLRVSNDTNTTNIVIRYASFNVTQI